MSQPGLRIIRSGEVPSDEVTSPRHERTIQHEPFQVLAYEYMAEMAGQLYISPGYFAVVVPYTPPTGVGRMSRSRMIRRAHVQRPVIAGLDAFGMPLPPIWQTVTTALPCWIWTRSRRLMSDMQGLVTLEDTRALFPAGADVQEGDRLATVKDRLGTVCWTGMYRVDALTRRPDHLEGLLAKVD